MPRSLAPVRLALYATAVLSCGYPKAGTAPGPISPTMLQNATSRWPSATADSLEHGRQLFLAHCNECHDYPDRTAYNDADWQRIIPRMGKKAHLDPADTELVLQFVQTAREK